VILVGLTGGIGSGKSTVSALLVDRGAVIVDADAITRELQQPGQPVLAAIVERFGDQVRSPDGTLDRPKLASIVFGDPEALAALNAIVHPAVGAEVLRRIDEHRGTDAVVVLDIPLLVEGGRYAVQAVVVVDVEPEIAIGRLVGQRGMDESDARARMARQATREDRLAKATRVIDNSTDRAALEAQVDELWAWLQTLPPLPPPDQDRD
jgi:dephospho-CoA kinase